MWLISYPNSYKMEQSLECFFETLYTYEDKMSIKKDFIIGLQNCQLACMANPALMGRIGHAC